MKKLLLIFILSFLAQVNAQPNLVFIIVDDLNDIPLDPAIRPNIATPNIDRLAKKGVSFTNAHCNDPICAPSRASMLYGLYPQTSGLFWFENPNARGLLRNSVDLPHHLRNNQYKLYATGKVYHGGKKQKVFHDYGVGTNYGPHPINGDPYMGHHSSQDHLFKKMPQLSHKWEQTFGPLEDIPDWSHLEKGKKGWFLYGKPWQLREGHNRDLLPDELSANFCKKILSQKQDQPFALFAGLVRTHTPLYAPQEYFDRFPLESIKLPPRLKDDLSDCAPQLANEKLYGFLRYQFLTQDGNDLLMRQWIQAYLACVSFVDDQVGKIIDAIEASDHADNTVIIFTSDHGFHMGDKNFVYKQSLWDGATHVPLIISGLKNQAQNKTCSKPVSLIDLYPTINELCQISNEPNAGKSEYKLDGFSLRPYLMNPENAQWDGPKVAITALPGKDHSMAKVFDDAPFPHFSVRSEDWRYTLSSNGDEELYHYRSDPAESKNLAKQAEYAAIKANLKQELIRLRDGKKWQERNSLKGLQLQNLELQFEYKSSSQPILLSLRHGSNHAELPASGVHWKHARIRIDQNRREIWINNKLHSDSKVAIAPAGAISIEKETQVRGLRFREL